MGVTSIEWTGTRMPDGTIAPGYTFNPWEGCMKVSPGCTHCYAEARDLRWTGGKHWGPAGIRRITADANWRKPVKWNADAAAGGYRSKVFCASLADVFEDRPELVEPRARLFALIGATPNLDWLLLTKRPENVRRLAPSAWVPPAGMFPENVWVGATAENQERFDERVHELVQVPARIRFLSMEPLLEDVRVDAPVPGEWKCLTCRFRLFKRTMYMQSATIGVDAKLHNEPCPNGCGVMVQGTIIDHVQWVIVGGESHANTAKARPFVTAWPRSIVAQCRAAGVPVFVKQMGSNPRELVEPAGSPDDNGDLVRLKLVNHKGGLMSEWPEDLRVQEFPR
jgi:protein gp37